MIYTGKAPLKKNGNRGYADRYLWGVLGRSPDAQALRAVETYLILTTDHGLNASTFAGRVTASTGADVGAAFTAAVATLSGPLHGGAPGPVLDMLDSIGESSKVQEWVAEQLKAKRRIMGFGHRVYRTDDPRALVLRAVAQKQNGPRIALACSVEQQVLAALAAHQEEKGQSSWSVRQTAARERRVLDSCRPRARRHSPRTFQLNVCYQQNYWLGRACARADQGEQAVSPTVAVYRSGSASAQLRQPRLHFRTGEKTVKDQGRVSVRCGAPALCLIARPKSASSNCQDARGSKRGEPDCTGSLQF